MLPFFLIEQGSMTQFSDRQLIDFLSQFVIDERLNLFQGILKKRTRYITVVLEDIYQTQNASAVLRTCECFGLQDIHIIENQNPFKVNARVTLGSAKWLNLYRYNKEENNTITALKRLKDDGYRIIATVPDPKATSLEQLDLSAGKAAIVFGSENPGISKFVAEMADERLTIPMQGFTESLNISVSAATIIYTLTSKLRKSKINWHLTPQESNELLLKWLRKHIRRSDLLEARFREELAKKLSS